MRLKLADMLKQVGGSFDKIRITGTPGTTKLEGNKDKVLFVVGTMKEPIEEFSNGDFGMGDLSILAGLLNFPSYKAPNASLTVHQADGSVGVYVSEFVFRDEQGSTTSYKTMAPRLVGDQATIATIPWDVEVAPTKAKIAEFTAHAQLLSAVDNNFGVRIENGTMFLTIGSANGTSGVAGSHTATIAFATGIESKYTASKVVFNTSHLLTALKNAGNFPVKVRFSNKGIAGVLVETDFATYAYFLRAKEM